MWGAGAGAFFLLSGVYPGVMLVLFIIRGLHKKQVFAPYQWL